MLSVRQLAIGTTIVFVTILSLGLFILWAFAEVAVSQTAHPRPRFELLVAEPLHRTVGEGLDEYNYNVTMTVVHDRETGQERVCIDNGRGLTCWPTGREWK